MLTTLIAYLFAYAIRFRAGRYGDLLLFVTLIALFGGYLVKIYAWKSILGRDGIINSVLMSLNVIDEPIGILIYSQGAVAITLTYFLLPFAVLPIYGNMRAIPDDLIEAARDLGAGPFSAARDVVLPLCERGINVAFLFSFLIAAGDYVTPRFVGGGASMMGHFIETQFSFGFNWPMGSAMSFTLLAASLLTVRPVSLRLSLEPATMSISPVARLLWLMFLVVVLSVDPSPLLLVVIFSFNQSALTSFPLTGFTLGGMPSSSPMTVSGRRSSTASSSAVQLPSCPSSSAFSRRWGLRVCHLPALSLCSPPSVRP